MTESIVLKLFLNLNLLPAYIDELNLQRLCQDCIFIANFHMKVLMESCHNNLKGGGRVQYNNPFSLSRNKESAMRGVTKDKLKDFPKNHINFGKVNI